MSNHLTITITGGINSGKTILAHTLKQTLEQMEINVSLAELEVHEGEFVQLSPAFDRLTKAGLSVHIETAQLTRAGLMPDGRVPQCPFV